MNSLSERLDFLAASGRDPVDAQAMREAADMIRIYEDRGLAAWGTKRIVEMTRDEMLAALNALHRSYMAVIRTKMETNEVPVFHEDMDKWNEKLADWFNVPEAA